MNEDPQISPQRIFRSMLEVCFLEVFLLYSKKVGDTKIIVILFIDGYINSWLRIFLTGILSYINKFKQKIIFLSWIAMEAGKNMFQGDGGSLTCPQWCAAVNSEKRDTMLMLLLFGLPGLTMCLALHSMLTPGPCYNSYQHVTVKESETKEDQAFFLSKEWAGRKTKAILSFLWVKHNVSSHTHTNVTYCLIFIMEGLQSLCLCYKEEE